MAKGQDAHLRDANSLRRPALWGISKNKVYFTKVSASRHAGIPGTGATVPPNRKKSGLEKLPQGAHPPPPASGRLHREEIPVAQRAAQGLATTISMNLRSRSPLGDDLSLHIFEQKLHKNLSSVLDKFSELGYIVQDHSLLKTWWVCLLYLLFFLSVFLLFLIITHDLCHEGKDRAAGVAHGRGLPGMCGALGSIPGVGKKP